MKGYCEVCGIKVKGNADLCSQYCFDLQDVQNVLETRGEILATHDGADKPAAQGGYCYVSTLENLNTCSIRPVSPREALYEGWATVNERGRFQVGSQEICDANIDYRKLRRRIEDALRKTAKQGDFLQIAAILNVI